MSKVIRITFVLLTLIFLSVQFLSAQEPLFAPDFKLQDLTGNTVSLSDFRGEQPLILFFWTTWCPFCRRELKALNVRYPELTKAGWKIFAIDIGEPAYKVDRFIENYALAFNVLLDTDLSVAYAYDILGVPTYVLVDKQGRIIFQETYFPEQYFPNNE